MDDNDDDSPPQNEYDMKIGGNSQEPSVSNPHSPINRKVKFAESIVTYAADSSNATSKKSSNMVSQENSFSKKK